MSSKQYVMIYLSHMYAIEILLISPSLHLKESGDVLLFEIHKTMIH